jgi:hypothetical protein
MHNSSRIYPLSLHLILLFLIFGESCRKPEEVLPDNPKELKVDATVPVMIYTNIKTVYLDARRTVSLNSKRAIFFSWSCTSFPTASGKPSIIDSSKSMAWMEKPGIGQYIFKLTVKDNLGNFSETNYTMDVLEDSLTGKKPIAKAGPDQIIYAPKDEVSLNAFQTFSLNPSGRNLTFKWTAIEKPALASFVEIETSTLYYTNIYGLIEGIYKIQLEVKNEVGLSDFDTLEIKVLPDPLKGTIRVFENVIWKITYDDWGDYISIVIYDQNLFVNRDTGNMEVRVWDDLKKDWSDSKKYEWTTDDTGGLMIFYPYLEDLDAYYKMAGVKARVQVKFL